MREPGDEDDDSVVSDEMRPMTAAEFIAAGQRLIDQITSTNDTNLKQLYHRQLMEHLMRKR